MWVFKEINKLMICKEDINNSNYFAKLPQLNYKSNSNKNNIKNKM